MIARSIVLGFLALNIFAALLVTVVALFFDGSWWPLPLNIASGIICWKCYGSIKQSQESIARSKARIAEINAEMTRWSR